MNITKELILVVSKIAPTLGAALGGPAGGLVGTLLAKLFNSESTSSQDILAAINRDSEAATKLRELELAHQVELERIDAQNYASEVDDRKNARDLAVKNEWQTFLLAIGFLSFYAMALIAQMLGYGTLNPEIQGSLNIGAAMVLGFYFGSSKGERNKR